jgi:hypothetical protein
MADEETRPFFTPFMDEYMFPSKSENIGISQSDVSKESLEKFFYNFLILHFFFCFKALSVFLNL